MRWRCKSKATGLSSTVKFTPREINNFVCEAVNEIGYTRAYQDKWGAENTICGDDINVQEYISQQSPDIAQGLDGWGDQGIFFGMATPDRMTYGMPYDHTLAKELCKGLFESGLGGLDIKTQVVANGGFPVKIIVAVPRISTSKCIATSPTTLPTKAHTRTSSAYSATLSRRLSAA